MRRLTKIEANKPISLRILLLELWQYRELIWAFSSRDLKVKYFQTILGPMWELFTPLITVGVMTFVFGLMVKIPSDNLPYLLFYLVAIVPWYAFIAVLNQTTSSLEAHTGLINKIYFPRLVIGASYVVNGIVDFLVGYTVCIFFTIYYSLFSFQFILVMPLLLYIQMAWALGIGLLLAPYNAQFRDVKHITPLIIQLYYFASPIMYPVSVAPVWAQWIYKINPFAVVVNTYRTTLNGHPTDWLSVLIAFLFASGVLALGAVVFLKKEQNMVDIL